MHKKKRQAHEGQGPSRTEEDSYTKFSELKQAQNNQMH